MSRSLTFALVTGLVATAASLWGVLLASDEQPAGEAPVRRAGPPEAGEAPPAERLTPVAEDQDTQPSRTKASEYCPLAFAGQWNGQYYHYSQACPPHCTYATVPSSRMHFIDIPCQGCTSNPNHCSDPITSTYGRPKPQDADLKTARRFLSGLDAYVPPRHGSPGESDQDSGRFYRAGIHVEHLEGSDDEVIWLRDRPGRRRSFRVLKLRLRLPAADIPITVGQELDPNDVGSQPQRRGRHHGQINAHHHVLQADGYGDIHVVSKLVLEP